MVSTFHELSLDVFANITPSLDFQDRQHMSLKPVAMLFVPLLACYYLMAVLVLLPSTRLHRLALLLPALLMNWNAATCYDMSSGNLDFNYLNYSHGVRISDSMLLKLLIDRGLDHHVHTELAHAGVGFTSSGPGTPENTSKKERVRRRTRLVLQLARHRLGLVERLAHTRGNASDHVPLRVHTRDGPSRTLRLHSLRRHTDDAREPRTHNIRFPARRYDLRHQSPTRAAAPPLHPRNGAHRPRRVLLRRTRVSPRNPRGLRDTGAAPAACGLATDQCGAVARDVARGLLGKAVAPGLPADVRAVRVQTYAPRIRTARWRARRVLAFGYHALGVYPGHGARHRRYADLRVLRAERSRRCI
jgi:hypothetical protein